MTKEEAIKKAKEIAEKENWPWVEPSSATIMTEVKGWFNPVDVRDYWNVTTNITMRGCNIIIQLDVDTGELIKKYFVKH